MRCQFVRGRGLGLLLIATLSRVPSAAAQTPRGANPTAKPVSSSRTEEMMRPADAGEWEPILLPSPSAIAVPQPLKMDSPEIKAEVAELRTALASSTPRQKALAKKWVTPNQGKLWRAVLDNLSIHNIAGAPSTLRLYAALHIAIADAEIAARNRQDFYRRPHPGEVSDSQQIATSFSPFAYPSDLAAETGAAERILRFARPEAAGRITAMADESMSGLASSGLYLKSDCEAGRNLGRLVAEQVLSVLERDGRPTQLVFAKEMPWEQPDAPETVRIGPRYQLMHTAYDNSVQWKAPLLGQGITYGDLPPWNQALPVDPTAGDWKPLILENTKLFTVPAPPANSSAQTMRDMEEIATALNNRTCFTDFIAFKWANEQPGRWSAAIMDDLMDRYNWDAAKTARADAILFAAMYDALLTTWHEKFYFLRPRPALLEPSLPTVILTPKHPSYPAGHGTYVAAADTVLNCFFPQDEAEFSYLVPEVNNARVWGGVHFRQDMLAGNQLGREVAREVLIKVHLDGSPADRSKRVLGQPLQTAENFGDGGPRYQ